MSDEKEKGKSKNKDKCAENYYNDDKYYDKYCDDDDSSDDEEEEEVVALPVATPPPSGDRDTVTGPESNVDVGEELDSVNEVTPEFTIAPTVKPTTLSPPSTVPEEEEEEQPVMTGPGSDGCVFCDDPEYTVDPNLSVDGILCTDWQVVAWTNPSYEDCVLLRATAVAKCGCPFTVSEDEEEIPSTTSTNSVVCEQMCGSEPENDNSATVISRQYEEFKKLPNSELTCADVMTFPAVDGDETCRVIEETYSAWCGCPDAAPSCAFCENGLPPARPNAKFSRNGETCGAIADTVSTVPSSRCEQYQTDLVNNLGYDVHAFCGCLSQDYLQQGVMPAEGSSNGGMDAGDNDFSCENPCPEGTVFAFERQETSLVPDWNAPCQDWPNRFSYVRNSTLCENLQNNVVGPYCCNPVASDPAPTTDAPGAGGDRGTNAAMSENNSEAAAQPWQNLVVLCASGLVSWILL